MSASPLLGTSLLNLIPEPIFYILPINPSPQIQLGTPYNLDDAGMMTGYTEAFDLSSTVVVL